MTLHLVSPSAEFLVAVSVLPVLLRHNPHTPGDLCNPRQTFLVLPDTLFLGLSSSDGCERFRLIEYSSAIAMSSKQRQQLLAQ